MSSPLCACGHPALDHQACGFHHCQDPYDGRCTVKVGANGEVCDCEYLIFPDTMLRRFRPRIYDAIKTKGMVR